MRAKLKREAGKYLTDAQMTEHFPPDFKIYQPGTYTFNLKAGETTDHWIAIANGFRYGLSAPKDKFQIIFRSGDEVTSWSPGSWPSNKGHFKINTFKDDTITLKVLR